MRDSVLMNQLSMSKNMSLESTNFAGFLRTFTDKAWRIANIIEEFAYNVSCSESDSSYELCNKINSELDFVIAWFTFNYLYNEYEKEYIEDSEWQVISDFITDITIANCIEDLEASIDKAMEILNYGLMV